MVAPAQNRRLDWVEVGRGLAASAVVASHMPPFSVLQEDSMFNIGTMGVEFFFTLSGFIMFYVHQREFGDPRSVKVFVWKRILRIYPTYWFTFAVVLAATFATMKRAYRPELDLPFIASNLFLVPDGIDLPFVSPAWTLHHELLFYIVFGSVILNKKAGIIIFLIWMAAVLAMWPVLGSSAEATETYQQILFHHYNLDFAIGIGMGVALKRSVELRAMWCALVASLVLWSVWAWLGRPVPSALSALAMKALFAGVLMGAVMISKRNVAAPRVLMLLGSASYATYLINRDFGFFVGRVFNRLGRSDLLNTWPVFIFAAGSAIVIGIIIYWWFERPLLRMLSGRLSRRPSTQAS